ncbi:hypothetical protein ABZW11_42775 [Nonomuraea sp. NPDC004580]|uniref:hypothetical protein n=1 Tax=Nonomuraea sp. NPDC004580 TaxID=3154552 RepID=UPI00339F8146
MLKRVAPAIGLFFLSPLAGEFLLGNLPITMLPALVALAPLYGGGALLIRELARRTGAGWPGIVLLALAYALIEEGLVTRSLFAPSFAGMDLTAQAWIPGVEMSAWWAGFVLGGVHVAGSVCAPIAVMEALVPARASEPWLRVPGLVAAGVLFVLGAVMASAFDPGAYVPSAAQVVGVLVAVALLAFVALRRRTAGTDAGQAPGPWPVLGCSMAAGAVFWLANLASGMLGAWPVVAINLAVYAVVCVLAVRWSRRSGWGLRQTFALGAGSMLTYAWHGFLQPSAVPVAPAADLVGDVVFAVAAVALLAVIAARLRTSVMELS